MKKSIEKENQTIETWKRLFKDNQIPVKSIEIRGVLIVFFCSNNAIRDWLMSTIKQSFKKQDPDSTIWFQKYEEHGCAMMKAHIPTFEKFQSDKPMPQISKEFEPFFLGTEFTQKPPPDPFFQRVREIYQEPPPEINTKIHPWDENDGFVVFGDTNDNNKISGSLNPGERSRQLEDYKKQSPIETWEEYFEKFQQKVTISPRLAQNERAIDKVIGYNFEFKSIAERDAFLRENKSRGHTYNFCVVEGKPKLFTQLLKPF